MQTNRLIFHHHCRLNQSRLNNHFSTVPFAAICEITNACVRSEHKTGCDVVIHRRLLNSQVSLHHSQMNWLATPDQGGVFSLCACTRMHARCDLLENHCPGPWAALQIFPARFVFKHFLTSQHFLGRSFASKVKVILTLFYACCSRQDKCESN